MKNAFFSYSKGKGFAYSIPTFLKVVLYFALSAVMFSLRLEFVALSIAFIIAAYSVSGIGVCRLLADLKQAVACFVMILWSDVISIFIRGKRICDVGMADFNVLLVLRTVALISLASFLFRSTGFYDMWKLSDDIERIIFGKKKSGIGAVSGVFVMFVSFIPQTFSIWRTLETSYLSRGGRRGIRMVMTLMPMLIRNSMIAADMTSDSLASRR